MARRKFSEAPPEAPAPQEPAPVPDLKLGEPYVKLRLRENHFVRGQFTTAGTVFQFPKADAERRLKTTELWDRV